MVRPKQGPALTSLRDMELEEARSQNCHRRLSDCIDDFDVRHASACRRAVARHLRAKSCPKVEVTGQRSERLAPHFRFSRTLTEPRPYSRVGELRSGAGVRMLPVTAARAICAR